MTGERAVTFECQGEPLLGILHEASSGSATDLGVLIVVGGPQYRVGSHRQFVLMARAFAQAGFPAFRFDYRGMGDSAAEPRSFDAVDDDLRAAADTFLREQPALRGLVVFGLCDAASAAMMYAPRDGRVRGLILANPWVRSVAGEARAYVRHYYGRRLLQASFWRKVMRGELGLKASLGDFLGKLRASTRAPAATGSFIDRMLAGVRRFQGPALFLLSGHDLTADEFADRCRADAGWRAVLEERRHTRVALPEADHTFSSAEALADASTACIEWLQARAVAWRDVSR